MSALGLETVVEHDGHLNLLCCLLDSEQLSVRQIAARIGETTQAVRYWIRLLSSFDLVEKRDELGDGEVLYGVSLDAAPDWVHEAVRQHRARVI